METNMMLLLGLGIGTIIIGLIAGGIGLIALISDWRNGLYSFRKMRYIDDRED